MGQIRGTTQLVGVFGYPVAHSLSPPMHNAAFAALGLDWAYVPFPVAPEALPRAVAGLAALGIRGVNATIPHKQALLPLMDTLTPEARAIGSVNTIVVRPDGLLGHSTDGAGFLRGLTERGFVPRGTRAALLGAGGAARAVVGALAGAGVARISIIARTPARAADLPAVAAQLAPGLVAVEILPWTEAARPAVLEAELVVNASPIGMAKHDPTGMPVPATWLRPGQWVYDLVYTPRETALLRAAAAAGCQTVDGVTMLVYQGAEAFALWTGIQPPAHVMEEAVLAHLRQHA